ncbi:MAG: hypothetical protein PWR01_4628 [Clostridiales bacterium]|nr:hypothetical protein [Clostridiales bacterium]MDN5283555.1 hypothetical protein [Candidatus Ozemobacter sp.]
MPGRDGTGPVGSGPAGFRGRINGGCVGSAVDSYARPMRGGRGGRGGGRARLGVRARSKAWGAYDPDSELLPDNENELAVGSDDSLRRTVEELKNMVMQLQAQLTEKKAVQEDETAESKK